MILDYAPGMSLTDPWVFTNSRSTAATFWDVAGVVRTASANVTRDRHYPLGPVDGRRTTLLEPAATNSCLQSQAWATAPWGQNNMTSVTNNAAAAPDLTTTATKLTPNATSTPFHYLQQTVTITSGEFVAASCFVKSNGYNGIVFRFADPASTAGFQMTFDLSTGTVGSQCIGIGVGVLTGFKVVPLANGWYWLAMWGQVNGGFTTTTQIFCFNYDTVAHADAGASWSGDTSQGCFVWGAQLERNGTLVNSPPTSYVVTGVGVATRNADSASTPWPFQTMPMWGYAKLIDLGWAQRAAFSRLVTLSNAAGGIARITVMTGFTTAGANPGAYRFSYVSDYLGGAGDSAIQSSSVRGYGTSVELFWRFGYNPATIDSTEMSVSVASGAVSTTSSGNSATQVDLSSPTFLTLGASVNEGALVGLQRLKLGFDPTHVTTLARGAAV